jgi:two-component system sensor histidine kinase YesM
MIFPKTIHSKIFFSYALLIILIISVFLFSFSIYMSSVLRQNASNSLQQLSFSVQYNLDSELKSLSTIALKVISSEQIKKAFFDDTNDLNNSFTNEKSLSDLILSINGPQKSFSKLILYRNDGLGFEYGVTNRFFKKDMEEIRSMDWAVKALALQGKKLFTPVYLEDEDNSNKPALSLCESFFEIYGMKPDNLIEIRQDYKVFANIVDKSFAQQKNDTPKDKLVFVFDKSGNIIYPYTNNAPREYEVAKYCWEKVESLKALNGDLIIKNPLKTENLICAYKRSDFSEWTTLFLEPEQVLILPVNLFIKNLILLGFVLLLLTLVISYYVSKNLTTPIKKIRNSLKELDLNSLTPQKALSFKSDIDELQELNSTYLEMRERVKESLNEAVSARSHEIQSRLLALQSQMNPHFLFNSLSFISIMCEEQGNLEVVKFCKGLSEMLRYISSDRFNYVTLGQEVEHTRNYLFLVERRYCGMLKFEIDVPEALLDVKVPKLILQPLVENSMKYGMGNDAPWIIKVTGYLLEAQWLITVSDNGGGFEQEKLKSLKQKIHQVDTLKEMPKLELSGMGLVNIYTRLKLFYEDAMIFKIENIEHSGALVSIGGLINSRKENANV